MTHMFDIHHIYIYIYYIRRTYVTIHAHIFHRSHAPTRAHPRAHPSDNGLGADGGQALAAPLALLTQLSSLDLRCAVCVCGGGGDYIQLHKGSCCIYM